MTTHGCIKADKIDKMEKSIKHLELEVLEGTNGDSLKSVVKQTKKATDDIGSDVRQLLIFQTVVETEREMKEEIREKKTKRMQWIIVLLASSVFSLITIIIAIIKTTG